MLQRPDQEFLERTTGFEPATLTLAKKRGAQLPYLHLCKSMQDDSEFLTDRSEP